MTPWVTRLLFANAAMYLVSMAFPQLWRGLVLVPVLIPIRPWTVITYMFLHAGLFHLFFNMLALYFFGPRVEERLGSSRFIMLYFAAGIMAAIVSLPFTPRTAIVGASGAVFGVLLAFARYWPRALIYIWGVLPIQARWLVIIMTALSLYGGLGGARGGIAHFAHLGGFLGGWLYMKWAEWRSPARKFKKKADPTQPPVRDAASAMKRWQQISRDDIHPVNREELDRILDKIGAHGVGSLSPEERGFLERFSSN
jgi:membrane associated rhomboid family serine protease